MMSDAELKKIVLGFRVSDLQVLLGFAGRNKNGKKQELQKRALDLIKIHSSPVELKIRELQKRRNPQAKLLTDPPAFPTDTTNQPRSSGFGNSASHNGPLSMGHGFLTSHVKQNINKPVNIVPQYAVNPDVKFKDLPFFDVLGELLKPSSLVPYLGERFQERDFGFHLTPQQARDISREDDIKVQLRLCLLETSCEQEDNFPSSICVKINNKLASLPNPIPTNKPGIDPKRPSRPVDITQLCRLTPVFSNDIHISWASSYGRAYVVAVYLVRKQNSGVLISRLRANGVRNPDHTTGMIKEKLCQDRDSEIATMSLRGSLLCPLGKIKMILPCRALTCTHLQCFDATLYVQMNEKKPKWICPVCDKPALFKDLAIDGLFLDIASKAPDVCTEVQFHENGSWTPVMPVKKEEVVNDSFVGITVKKEAPPKPKEPVAIEIISLDSDSDTEDSWPLAWQVSSIKPVCASTPKSVTPAPVVDMMTETKTENLITDKYAGLPPIGTDKLFQPSSSSSSSSSSSTVTSNSSSSQRETINVGSLEIRPISPASRFSNSPKFIDGLAPTSSTSTSGSHVDHSSIPPVAQSSVTNFDLLYSLIHQNQREELSFLPVKEKDSCKQNSPRGDDNSSPDVIAID